VELIDPNGMGETLKYDVILAGCTPAQGMARRYQLYLEFID
jgi:hypothetical protein